MLTDEEIMAALQEEACELPPDLPGGLTLEASIVAQRVEIADMTELELHVLNQPARQGKPDSECELGSCENEATHYCTFLSGALFFGCEGHVDELVSMRAARKKKVFEKEATEMDKEQRKRAAYRSVIQYDESQGDIEYTVKVSGERVEIHQTYDHNWENEDGTGPDVSHEMWVLSKDVFKSLLEAGQWCVEKSEAFGADHPEASHSGRQEKGE